MYLSVIFLAAETPRYRAPLDPFIVLLAAIAVTQLVGSRDSQLNRGDHARN